MIITGTSAKLKDIVEGKYDPPISSFALKIKINFLRLNVKNNLTSSMLATKELAEFCKRNEETFKKDLHLLF